MAASSASGPGFEPMNSTNFLLEQKANISDGKLCGVVQLGKSCGWFFNRIVGEDLRSTSGKNT